MTTTTPAAAPAVGNGTATGQAPLSELVSGIVSDAQRLFKQQAEMVRAEFKEDLRQTSRVVQYMGVGVGLLALGGAMLVVSLVYLLNWAYPDLPLFACWAIVGGSAALLGGVAMFVAYRILGTYNPLPDKSFNALQENVSWAANPQS